MKRASIAVTLAAAFLFQGCGTNQVITNLELAVSAVEIALPLIGPSAGLPADLQTQIQKYLAATSQAIGKASDILSGPGDDGSKAAQITADFAGIAAPVVPVRYQGIATAVQQVAVLVSKFLGGLPSPSSQPLAVRAPGARPVVPGQTTKLSASDLARLSAIKARAGKALTP